MTGASIEVDTALLALKVAFLVLLYVFIWVIVRSATRDLRAAPQESIVLSASEAQELRARAGAATPPPAPPPALARLVVLDSPALPSGAAVELTGPTSIGRGAEAEIRLEDDFVSSRHARLEVRREGVWLEDAGSTNGTYVNGARVTSARLLQPGDVLRIGQTDFRVER